MILITFNLRDDKHAYVQHDYTPKEVTKMNKTTDSLSEKKLELIGIMGGQHPSNQKISKNLSTT